MKHTEIPHQLDNYKNEHSLEHGDKIIYASVRRYMNAETRLCFPAVGTIASNLKCSTKKVQAALKRLVEVDLIRKSSSGRKNCYEFPESDFDKQFEMFTDAFLDMDLPLNVKEYYMDIQQYLYGKDTGVGKCSFSNAELSRRTGWTVVSVKKYNTILIEKGLLEEETTDKWDQSGFPIIQKNFDLAGLNQATLWAKQVTAAVVKHEQDIQEMKSELASIKQELEEVRTENKQLKKEMALRRNQVQEINPVDISFLNK